jgi:hypothetical protein
MDPGAVRDLLLNLKLQLLALPGLVRWGLLAFAGIVVLREAITLGWNVYTRRSLRGETQSAKLGGSSVVGLTGPTATHEAGAALPAPDPLAMAEALHREDPSLVRQGAPPVKKVAGVGGESITPKTPT